MNAKHCSGLLVLVFGVLSYAHADGWDPPAREIQLRKEIEIEIASLGDKTWAGQYYEGDGLGVNIVLTLAPNAGFTFTWRGCLGLYGHNYGTVSEKGGKIILVPALPNKEGSFGCVNTAYVPIRWGARRYLIPETSVEEFCNNINGGYEPRKDIHGSPLLRVGDENKKVSGLPELPDVYLEYLLQKPVTANIIGVAPAKTEPAAVRDSNLIKHNVIVDAGSTKGVHKGLRFYVVEPSQILNTVIITSVEPDRAMGVYSYTSNSKGEGPPEKSWKVSTKSPY